MTQETSISRHCPPIEVLGAHRVRPKKRRPETSEVIRVSEPETLRSTWIKKGRNILSQQYRQYISKKNSHTIPHSHTHSQDINAYGPKLAR